MLGASLLKCAGFAEDVAGGEAVFGGEEALILLVGCAVAFFVSIAAIRFLMDFVKNTVSLLLACIASCSVPSCLQFGFFRGEKWKITSF